MKIFLLLALLLAVSCSRNRLAITPPRASGEAGNGTDPSGSVQNGGPGAAIPVRGTLDLRASSDSGHSNSDNITKINAPIFEIRMEGTTDFSLYANDEKVFTGRSDGGGEFIVQMNPLADGEYRMQARWQSSEGIVGTQIIKLCIDTVAPSGLSIELGPWSDSGRSNSDNITNQTHPLFVVTSIEPIPPGDSPSSHLLRYRIVDDAPGGAKLLLIDSYEVENGFVAGGTRSYQLTGPGLADGHHSIGLHAEDLAGNTSQK